jgi:hypothetical protein
MSFWRVTDWFADVRAMYIAVAFENKRTWEFMLRYVGGHLYRQETGGVLELSIGENLRILGWGLSSCHSAQQTAACYQENF